MAKMVNLYQLQLQKIYEAIQAQYFKNIRTYPKKEIIILRNIINIKNKRKLE